ncbi:Ig-like domain-containing protein [Sporosarcina sp. FA9]|uniref:Ig-like domain-containing protein n=1 Tax=Sporosarcina sp. FA9 TaxID=3413030 RepID=UPI003F6557FD
MAIEKVRVKINGVYHDLTYNSTSKKYEKTITAPNVTSYNVNAGHYYPVEVEATNTAGTQTTVTDLSPTIGNSLKLLVKEKIKPTINVTTPGAGAFISNSRQPIVFQLRDEANGSGVDITKLALKIDGGTTITNVSAGMVCTLVSNGYDCTYTPPTALSDGAHTVTINLSDFDGNAATQSSRTYTVDTIPPTLNITNPSNNFITNSAALVLQGSTNDATSTPVTVAIKLNNVDQGAVPVTSGSFSKSLTLKSGANAIIVTATDAAGQVTTVTINGTLDTSTPVISTVSITPNPVDAGATMIISVDVSG